MVCHAVPCHFLPAGAGAAIVAVGVDGDAATGGELTPDLDILGVHEPDEVLHDDVHAVLMEVAVIAEGEEVELQALALHHALIGDIGDGDGGKVRLAGDGAQAGKLRAVELDEVVVAGMLVLEGLQHLRGVVGLVAGVLVAQQGQGFFFSHSYT